MIEVISGTNRPNCNALRVAKIILGFYRELGVESQILNLQELPPAIFDSSSYAEKPESFLPFQNRVLDADGLHVVTPEYNGSFPGVLKYFVDMLKFPESFERRPVAFVGEAAGVWGGFRSVEQMQLIFGYRNAILLPERVWIPQVNTRFDDEGRLKDEGIADRLRDQAKKFAAFVRTVKGAETAPGGKTEQ